MYLNSEGWIVPANGGTVECDPEGGLFLRLDVAAIHKMATVLKSFPTVIEIKDIRCNPTPSILPVLGAFIDPDTGLICEPRLPRRYQDAWMWGKSKGCLRPEDDARAMGIWVDPARYLTTKTPTGSPAFLGPYQIPYYVTYRDTATGRKEIKGPFTSWEAAQAYARKFGGQLVEEQEQEFEATGLPVYIPQSDLL